MNCLSALLLVAAAAYTIARPPDTTADANVVVQPPPGDSEHMPPPRLYPDYILPRLLVPHYRGYDDSPRIPIPPPPPPHLSESDWLTREIDLISQMDEDKEPLNNYDSDLAPWLSQEPYMRRILDGPVHVVPPYIRSFPSHYYPQPRQSEMPMPMHNVPMPRTPMREPMKKTWKEDEVISQEITSGEEYLPQHEQNPTSTSEDAPPLDEQRNTFALTPLDKGYYDHDDKHKTALNLTQEEMMSALELEPPRKTRQNPNLSRTKTLVAENIGKLRTGLANKDYRLPVSLLPANLEFLKINRLDDEERGHDESTDKPRHIHVLEPTAADPSQSIYGVAIVSAVGAALAMTIVGFAFGWYTLSKKAKAAADVDYPAYGVTGPSLDASGDRKLAHSAHMYHYQHQKQQIIAMERNGMEQRAGSISDPESEEENEEGDYTVYECPGFATTGDMEVKNPLFSDDPTPATPGKCEIVKPQPKD